MICWIEEYHLVNASETPRAEYRPSVVLPCEPDTAKAIFQEQVQMRHQFTSTSDKLIVMQLVTKTGPTGDDKKTVARAVIDCSFTTGPVINWNWKALDEGQEWERKEAELRDGN